MARAYYPSGGTFKEWTADMVGADGYYEYKIDLTASTYNADTYYPVVGSNLPSGTRRLGCWAQDDTGTPSWSLHPSKRFTCGYEIYIRNGNYGWISTEAFILADVSCFTSVKPYSFNLLEKSGTPVFYLRGGAGYHVFTDYPCTWSIKTNSFKTTYDTVAPTTTRPTPHGNLVTIGARVDWDNVNNKPSTFTPSSHTHPISDITNLQTTLNAKAPSDIVTISSTQPTSSTCKIWVKV